ncbi:MAG: hypothetical protein IJS13_08010, partial [Paludibacteraceae bacterium]|nr:hypothetical protein [Paludibacteraceae bacterium]
CVIVNASGVIFSKAAALKVGDEYKSFKACGDYMFWTQIAEQGTVAYVRKNLTYFRQHSVNMTSNSYAMGNESVESRRVYDYIEHKYNLSSIQKYKVHTQKIYQYHTRNYYDEVAQSRSLEAWGINKEEKPTLIGNMLLWLSMMFQRHLGILI